MAKDCFPNRTTTIDNDELLDEEDDSEDEVAVLHYLNSVAVAVTMMTTSSTATAAAVNRKIKKIPSKIDHRTLPRKKRKIFQHQQALDCIRRDYLQQQQHQHNTISSSSSSSLVGKDFPLVFRMDRGRFQILMEDVMNDPQLEFYHKQSDPLGRMIASVEARLLLPLKTLAYGVPSHTFIEYFQMSKEMARECCRMFDRSMQTLYKNEYLRIPTAEDLQGMNTLHQHQYGVPGMMGSLDCSYTHWKNCPKAWQVSSKGNEEKNSTTIKSYIVMEALCDYHLWIWHISYGYAGTMNDLNILNQSPFLKAMTNGDLDKLEEQAQTVPYNIGDEEFKKMFILVNEIYPEYNRFVQGIQWPMNSQQQQQQQHFTDCPNGTRNDIARAFGVMQSMWQFMARPILLMSLEDIAARVTAVVILHNMLVKDRVMERQYRTSYKPAHHLEENSFEVAQPGDLVEVQEAHNLTTAGPAAGIGVCNLPPTVVAVLTSKERYQEVANTDEHARLHKALQDQFH